MPITVKGWVRFQHYHTRKPPWIKLYRDLLDNYDFHCLQDASKALAPLLWLLASEYDNGTIPHDLPMIAYRFRMTEEKLTKCLKELESKGFITCYHDASTALAPCKHLTRIEGEAETYKQETEKEGETPQAASARFVKPSFAELHAYCVERGWKVDPQQWLAHYEANGWKVGRNPMKDWKAAVRTWEKNGIERSGNGNRESTWLSAAERRTRDANEAISNALGDIARERASSLSEEQQFSSNRGTLQRVGDTMPLLRTPKPH